MYLYRALLFSLCLLPALVQADDGDITVVLDGFHKAAAVADEESYLGLVTEDMVFLGTDASERWQGQAWRDFVHEHFSQGRGWEYQLRERHIKLSPDGRSAWFDEMLDNEQLGLCRGSGVLVKGDEGWQISQYNLSMPVPNDMIVEVAREISGETSGPVGGATEAAAGEESKKRCRKRHKTNRMANC